MRLPRLHLPSVVGRLRADRGPLALAGAVVVLGTALAAGLPPAVGHAADLAVSDLVARAGADADLVYTVPFEPDYAEDPKQRDPGMAATLRDSVELAGLEIPRDLAAALQPPAASITSADLKLSGHGAGDVLQLAYVSGGRGARVSWTAGSAPGTTAREPAVVVPPDSGPWPVEVGVSEQTAAALHLRPGDRLDASDPLQRDMDIRVSGVFRPVDPLDPAWQQAPGLLAPQAYVGALVRRTVVGGLLSPTSLPDARVALDSDYLTRAVSFAPAPARLDRGSSTVLAGAVVRLEARYGGGDDGSPTWRSQLDRVLHGARRRVATATAQAALLFAGLVLTTSLVLVLAAEQLVRRRRATLADLRVRGASLPGLLAELAVESVLVTVPAAAAGLLAARVLGSRPPSLTWPVPVLAVALLAPPLLGVRAAARSTGGRRAPANRSARRSLARTAQLRRGALEVAVLLAAAAALVALRQRGVVPVEPDDVSGALLPALAPTLVAATGALVLLRLLPLGARLARGWLRRGTRTVPFVVAARASTTAARPLPFLVVTVGSALAGFALCLAATQTSGQADGAWFAVGADAQLHTQASASVRTLAGRAAGSDGVRIAVPARVSDVALVSGTSTGSARLVVADAPAFERLLATTPLPDAPQLARLHGLSGGRVPALVRTADPALLRGKLALRWDGEPVALQVVGGAPPLGDGGPLVVVDAASFAAAGADAPPDTVWATGPRAASVLRRLAGPDAAITVREAVQHERRTSPLPQALLRLAELTATVMLALALLGLVLGAAATAPARGQTLARLRTLGLRPVEARRAVAGELLPPALLAAAGGTVLGTVLARTALRSLSLRLVTGQPSDPALAVPWTVVVPLVLLPAGVAVLVVVESSLRRRQKLGQVLRVGGT
ncbi:putative ABC transport system permease protein [Motilibacter peucedani]|uniref:Putative ABC transport system permease protein n=1 Tax=Motilibacter peucedani TaxID=598650 RepID=A0A420XU96_9ACTN|nr:FtsX-like permease family protein [Motilibacter peucedani]RKS80405.1 putative ABC transport system permease protein [Motilibacter peucedani]